MHPLARCACLIALVPTTVVAQDAFEENDACADAVPVGSGTFPALDAADGDDDWYAVHVPFGGTLTAEIRFSDAAGVNDGLDLFLFESCADFIPLAFGVSETDDETIVFVNNSSTETLFLTTFVSFEFGANDYELFIDTPSGPLPSCICEVDGDASSVSVTDLLAFLELWFPSDAGADIDGVAGVSVLDLLAFLDCWFPAASAGCP